MPSAAEVAAKDAKYGPIVAIVNSNSEPDKKYEVRQNPGGFLSCQCMGWRFNKESPRRCKHTDAVKGQGKVKPMTPSAVAAAQASGPAQRVREEAQRVAREILQYASGQQTRPAFAVASEKIEAAIRKFMGKLPAAATVPEFEEASTGIRMITLDD